MRAIKVLLLIGMLAGCAKDKETKPVEPGPESKLVAPKNKLKRIESGEFLYIPLYGKTPRDIGVALPQWLGKEKIVSLKIEENFLEISETEKEERFQDNPLNAKPVLSIPVEHIDYVCVTDDFGECTNQIKKDYNRPWESRDYIEMNIGEMKVRETNILPIQLANLYNKCYEKVSSTVIDDHISQDSLIITAEETYKADPRCVGISSLNDLSNLTFKIHVHYNLIRLDTIASSNYKKLPYSIADQNVFGFFDTEKNRLDLDNDSDLSKQEFYANRWNPEKSNIIYYLNDDFKEPGNEKILEATKYSVEVVNDALRKAGAKFQISLRQGSDKDIQDVRKSMIILENDPTKRGILGYGPSITNPHTGEIVSARSVMYKGNIAKTIEREYNYIVEKRRQEARQERLLEEVGEVENLKVSNGNSPSPLASLTSEEEELVKNSARQLSAANSPKIDFGGNLGSVKNNLLKVLNNKDRFLNSTSFAAHPDALSNTLYNELGFSPVELAVIEIPLVNHIEVYSANNAYPEEMLNIRTALEVGLENLLPRSENLANWGDLSEEQQQGIFNEVMPMLWVPTLVHEIGHNLGLRHNFSASEDMANFYSKEELEELGLKREIRYSSVMDYGFNSFTSLPVMGKYDVAALRYAYAQKVEKIKEDGKIELVDLELPVSKMESLKPYNYCTDEHVAVNPGCNRHDEGVGMKNIVEFLKKRNEFFYDYRNLRNNRVSFSLFGNIPYHSRIQGDYNLLRLNFETYERIRALPFLQGHDWENGEYPENTTEQDKVFLRGLTETVEIVGDFFINKLLEPDLICALMDTQEERPILIPQNSVDASQKDCFNLRLNPRYQVIGQAGKSFESKRTTVNNFMDQIDVRGVWIDKLVAVENLFIERHGMRNFDEQTSNFLTHPVVGSKLMNAVAQILFDEVTTDIEFKMIDGSKQSLPDFTYQPSEMFNIKERIHPVVDFFIGTNVGKTTFAREMIRKIKYSINDQSNQTLRNKQLDIFSVSKHDCRQGMNIIEMGGDIFCATHQNIMANIAINRARAVDTLKLVEEERIKKIFEELVKELQGQPVKEPLELSEADKRVKALGPQMLQLHLQGKLREKSFYNEILNVLAERQYSTVSQIK